ncbi:DNA polymerase III subunit chi [Pseudomonas sp. Pseusp122]|uniref:DNA polymerase III subunit chi n=1 Tax=unclassified Pseudomonas TaxID=196821 RepID=UPI0039A6F191
MDTSKPQKEAAHLLDDLESIRQLLGDESQSAPASSGETQIPLLFDVVGAHPVLTPELDFDSDDSRIPTLTPTPAPAPAPKAPTVSKADALLHLDRELRDAAQLIMQDVIDDFAPHIETEIKRRLDVRLERLLSQYQD